MNKTVGNIYQLQLKLTRYINNTLNNEWGMDQHTIQLNKLNQYKQLEDSLNNIDLNLYTVLPFDTEQHSSYILFHRSFSHQLAMIAIGLRDKEILPKEKNTSLIEQFCCYKISEIIASFFDSINIDISISKTPTMINLSQLSDFSSDLLVANLSLQEQQSKCGNCYIIFPHSLFGGVS